MSYTMGMKTAVSIPDDVFAEAEKLRQQLEKSRSELYSHALREYVARHGPDYITETLDQICSETLPDSSFARAAAKQILRSSEW